MKKKEMTRLLELTERLRQLNEQARKQFVERTRGEGYECDFYGEVKPFAEKVEQLADEWRSLVLRWIQEEKPDKLYPIQIHDTYDNLIAASVLVFQKDARRKRLLEMIKSIDYVLESAAFGLK
ncbi:MAG TPA: YppE family protein [Bacillales bacterium]|nr:YppE family protein [Bacillales bacterium]